MNVAPGRDGNTSAREPHSGLDAFTLIAKGVNGIVYEFDVATGTVQRTGRMFEIMGYHPHEVPNTADWWHNQIHPEDLAEIRKKHIDILRAGGDQLVSCYRVKHRDGRWIDLEDRAWVICDAHGQMKRIVGYSVDITDRRKAEAELRDREEQLRVALSAGRMGTWIWDIASGMVVTDALHRQLFDIETDAVQVPVDVLFSRVHPDDIAKTATPDRVDRVAQPFDLDFRVVRRDGTIRWLRASSKPIQDSAGKVTHLVGVNFDITEAKNNERVLRETTRRMSVLAQLADATRNLTDPREILSAALRLLREHLNADRCGWAEVDPDDIHFTYSGSEQAPGVPPVTGRYPISAFGADVVRIMSSGQPFVVNDAENDLPDQADRAAYAAGGIAALIAIPLLKKGRFVAGMGAHSFRPRHWTEEEIDLTREVVERCWESIERARAEQAIRSLNTQLQDQVEELRALLDILPVSVLRSDATCTHITGNAAGYDMLRLKPGANLSRAAMTPLPPDATFRVFANDVELPLNHLPMQSTARTATPVRNLEEDIHFPDGSSITVLCNTVPLLDAQGKVRSVLGVFMDITERKKVERALRAASEAKDHFLAVLSHELRTPLSPVLTAAQLLEGDPTLKPHQHELAQTIRRNVELEARLIDDLLDLTRIARNKLELHPTSIDLHEKIHNVLKICEEEITQKRLQIKLELHASSYHLHADPARMQQIVWNLLKNATKFTPDRGSITVRTSNNADKTILLQVIDTGVGITAEMLPRIFDAFEQGGRAITRQFGGMGLGLAISKALTELHGGTIQAHSGGAGTGATFTVTFPTIDAPVPAMPALPITGLATFKCSILLVEDHHDTRRVMQRVLRDAGCEVTPAATMTEALTAATARPYDLLISDIGLPDGSGVELLQRLRAAGRAPLAIALSGYGMEDDIKRSTAVGFAAHLTKPVNLRTLSDTVQKLMMTS